MLSVTERFLNYVKIDTQSEEGSDTSPSTLKQHRLAGLLVFELEKMGAEEIFYDREHCYVYASLPASEGMEDKPVLGFIAHMDTSPAVSGKDVKPQIIKDYDGSDILLNKEQDIVMKTADFPELTAYIGKSLIVTDGARLSFMGLPCPNLCTGGHNYHGRFEYICIESMEKVVEILIGLAQE